MGGVIGRGAIRAMTTRGAGGRRAARGEGEGETRARHCVGEHFLRFSRFFGSWVVYSLRRRDAAREGAMRVKG